MTIPMLPAAESAILIPPGDGLSTADMLAGTVHNWHNDTHPGPFQWCDEQPCNAVNRIVDSETTARVDADKH